MSQASSLAAAEAILATLGAGRAAITQIGAEYLPFEQQVGLHAALGGEPGRIAEVVGLLDRRIDVLRGRLRHPPKAVPVDGERVDDEPTPRGASTAAQQPSRLQRAIGRAEILKRPETPPVPSPAAAPPRPPGLERRAPTRAEPESALGVGPATAGPAASSVVAAPVVEGPPVVEVAPVVEAPPVVEVAPVVEAPPVVDAAPFVEAPPVVEAAPVVGTAPVAEHPPAAVSAPLAELIVPPALAEEPPVPVAAVIVAPAEPPVQAIDAPSPVAPPPMILAPDPVAATPEVAPAVAGGRPRRASPVLSVVAGGGEAENAVSPAGVRAAGPSLDDEAISSSADEDDDMLGAGTSAAGGGIQLGFGGKKVTTPSRPESAAPRLTDDEEPHTSPMAETPSIKPAGDDARISGLLDDAVAAAGKGDLNRAIQAFTDVLDMRHDRADAHIGRGRCYLELGDYSSAMSDFQRAEDLHPERPDAHVAMGDLYFARKEYRRAIEFYDQAVELDGSHAMARCRRGISHYYRKNYRQAFQDLQRAYSLDPDIPNIRKYVQMAVKKMERPD